MPTEPIQVDTKDTVVAPHVPSPTLSLADEFTPGSTVDGKYEVRSIVGEGGLAVVVAAHHADLDQLVAIKCLRREWLTSAPIVERFLSEARVATKIRSDHVVRVHDVGRTSAGTPYMVMEHLEGIDLRRKLEDGPLPLEEAVDYILQACEALAEAHVAGIVHRDLKPDNFFIARRAAGTSILKVLDFGISKSTATATVRTGGNEVIGTPLYMSPEQLRSASEVDARSDIWALGVVLFELLTTRMPFDGESLPQLCATVMYDQPASLIALRKEVSVALERVVMKCLAKDPDERFRNVAELARELLPFAPSRSEPSVTHIVAVVEEAGLSVRPPHIDPPVTNTEAIADLAPITLREEPPPDDIKPTSISSPKVFPKKRYPRLLALGFGLSMVVAGLTLIGYTALRVRSMNTPPKTTAATAPTSTTSTPAEEASQQTPSSPKAGVLASESTSPPTTRRPPKAGATPHVAGSAILVAVPGSVEPPREEPSAPAATGSATKRKFRTEY